jgi:hypothetical protein
MQKEARHNGPLFKIRSFLSYNRTSPKAES